MEQFKVNYDPAAVDQTILMALSLGKSSLALLDMVVDLIRVQKQHHRGRQGFFLQVMVIDESRILGPMTKDVEETVDHLKQYYPECKFTLHTLESLVQLFPLQSVNIDGMLGDDNDIGTSTNLFQLLPSLTRTSQQDLLEILRRQLILGYAKRESFNTIIWGYSTTRLAEMVLSLTTKGRGQDIPVLIDNEEVIIDNVVNIYPLKDLMSSEIVLYNNLQQLSELVVEPVAKIPATTKLQSINELVQQYFSSIEDNFPSIASTVVRTAEKLGIKPSDSKTQCLICASTVAKDSQQWLKNITVSRLPYENYETDVSNNLLPDSVDLCYGCLVAFKDTKLSNISWPRTSVDEVLNEYSIH